MQKSSEFNNLLIAKDIKYNLSHEQKSIFSINNLSIKKVVKKWTYTSNFKNCLALLSNDEENMEKLMTSLFGISPIIEGKILINNVDITFSNSGFERKMTYVDMQLHNWNKVFSVKHNLFRIAKKNKPFLETISDYNKKIKADIGNLENTGLNLDSGVFKEKLIVIIKNFINETQSTRNNFIKEYEYQINHFHKNFASENFKFAGCENLVSILMKKFMAEEENIIANNNLLFLQSLQDRISSLESLVGQCFCGCNPPKAIKKEFKLQEIIFVIKKINIYLNLEITKTRNKVKTTLKACNNYNKNFTTEINHLFSYKQITVSRSEIDQLLEQWIDLAEMQRIKFNMKQDFVSMQLLPDEMHLLLKNIKDEIKLYHEKSLKTPNLQDKSVYIKKLTDLNLALIDIRDVINENINMIFEHLSLQKLLTMRLTELTIVEKQIVKIIQQLIVPVKVLLLHHPFELLTAEEKAKLAIWIKKIQDLLHIFIIFSTNNQVDVDLLATNVTVIENQVVIQQGGISEVTNKPLSLKLLKETNNLRINIAKVIWKKPNLFFYNINIGKFDVENTPIVAFKASSVLFSIKKPKFLFLKNCIVLKGVVKDITKINEYESYLLFETETLEHFEILIKTNEVKKDSTGWISISKNSLFIFDSKTQHLIGTW